jgi:hypothetical protein
MSFQHHKTEKEKEKRRNKYWCLTQIARLNDDEARVYRDWTDSKVWMILNGECKPIPKYK